MDKKRKVIEISPVPSSPKRLKPGADYHAEWERVLDWMFPATLRYEGRSELFRADPLEACHSMRLVCKDWNRILREWLFLPAVDLTRFDLRSRLNLLENDYWPRASQWAPVEECRRVVMRLYGLVEIGHLSTADFADALDHQNLPVPKCSDDLNVMVFVDGSAVELPVPPEDPRWAVIRRLVLESNTINRDARARTASWLMYKYYIGAESSKPEIESVERLPYDVLAACLPFGIGVFPAEVALERLARRPEFSTDSTTHWMAIGEKLDPVVRIMQFLHRNGIHVAKAIEDYFTHGVANSTGTPWVMCLLITRPLFGLAEFQPDLLESVNWGKMYNKHPIFYLAMLSTYLTAVPQQPTVEGMFVAHPGFLTRREEVRNIARAYPIGLSLYMERTVAGMSSELAGSELGAFCSGLRDEFSGLGARRETVSLVQKCKDAAKRGAATPWLTPF